jgi:hypothetical protein
MPKLQEDWCYFFFMHNAFIQGSLEMHFCSIKLYFMPINNHNGTELNNVKETWDQNEKERANGGEAADDLQGNAAPATGLDQIIQKEASEYDNENKENRLLGGDRASVNDVENE